MRAVGPWGLGASIVNTVVGAGIFAVPAALATCIGPLAPLVFLACAIAVGSVALCFAEGGSRVPTSGGASGYVEAAFGPLVAYVVGTLQWFSDALACGGIAAAVADATVTLLPPAWRTAAHVVVIVGAIGAIAIVNLGGVARGARLVNAATVLKLIPLAIFVVVGAAAIHGGNFSQTVVPTTAGLGRAVIVAIFAFCGMEVALGASGEVANPTRAIPRALAVAMVSVTALYVAIQVIAQGILGTALAESSAPLADAMGRVSPALRALMLVGTTMSMLGFIGSDILGTPRILFAFARAGRLPRALGRVNPKTHAPGAAILTYSVITIGLALSGTFTELVVLSTLAVAPLYMAGCAAAWRLARRGVAQAGAPLGLAPAWLGAAAVTGIASMAAVIAMGSWAEIEGLAGAIAASAALYFVMGARRAA